MPSGTAIRKFLILSSLVGQSVPYCELFAGRSSYKELVGPPLISPPRASGPPGWGLCHSSEATATPLVSGCENRPNRNYRGCSTASQDPVQRFRHGLWPSVLPVRTYRTTRTALPSGRLDGTSGSARPPLLAGCSRVGPCPTAWASTPSLPRPMHRPLHHGPKRRSA